MLNGSATGGENRLPALLDRAILEAIGEIGRQPSESRVYHGCCLRPVAWPPASSIASTQAGQYQSPQLSWLPPEKVMLSGGIRHGTIASIISGALAGPTFFGSRVPRRNNTKAGAFW